MRLRYKNIFIFFLIFCTTVAFNANAGTHTFTWDPNPVADEVTEYRVYYRADSANYQSQNYFFVDISDPNFNPTSPSMAIFLPEIGESYCFVATAVDTDQYEGAYSDEIGDGQTCGSYVGPTPNPQPNVSSPGSTSTEADQGGGCFLSILSLF